MTAQQERDAIWTRTKDKPREVNGRLGAWFKWVGPGIPGYQMFAICPSCEAMLDRDDGCPEHGHLTHLESKT